MNCASCGTPLAENTRFCPKCGALTPEDGPITSYFPDGDPPPYVEQVSFIDKDTPDANKEGQYEVAQPQQPGSALQVSDGKTQRAFPASPAGGWQQPSPQGGQQVQNPPYPAGPQPPKGAQQQSPPQTPSYPRWGQPPQGAQQPQGYPGMGPQPQQPGNMPPFYGPQYQPQGYPGMGQQPSYPNWQGGAYPAGPPTTPPQTQWMRNAIIGLVALVVVLALLLGGVGTFLALQRNANPPAATQAQTVPTTQPAQATSTGAATNTDPQALFTQVTSSPPVLNDALSSQGAMSWQTPANSPAGSQCVFTGGALHVIGAKGTSAGCLSGASFGNFALQVKMTIIQGDVAGLVFVTNVVNSKINQYSFDISSDGTYQFVTVNVNVQNKSSSTPQLLSGSHSTAINATPNQSNVLTLIARNQVVYLYINKQFITTVPDVVTNANILGLEGGGGMKQVPVDVAYNNFQVWSL